MRILTYNIHKGIGGRDRRYRFGRILAVIEAENPDIVCLQEVDRNVRRSRFHDQPQLLADYFGNLERIYQMNVRLREGGYGNLLLSRLAAEIASSSFRCGTRSVSRAAPTGGDRDARRVAARGALAFGAGRT